MESWRATGEPGRWRWSGASQPTDSRMYQARFARCSIKILSLVACVNQLLVGHMNHRGGGGRPTVGRMCEPTVR